MSGNQDQVLEQLEDLREIFQAVAARAPSRVQREYQRYISTIDMAKTLVAIPLDGLDVHAAEHLITLKEEFETKAALFNLASSFHFCLRPDKLRKQASKYGDYAEKVDAVLKLM